MYDNSERYFVPSPLAHTAAGYAVSVIFDQRWRPNNSEAAVATVKRFVLVAMLAILPDLDSLAGLLTGNFGRFHNNATHSMFVGLMAAAIVGLLMSRKQPTRFTHWFTLTLLLYELHVVMDYLTIGRGVMALWPFSSARYVSPVPLFYGFHWSDGLWSIRHVWTLITEAVFAGILLLLLYGWQWWMKVVKRLTLVDAEEEPSQE